MARFISECLIPVTPPITNKRYPQLYRTHNRFKNKNFLAPEWSNFETMARVVGDRPADHMLMRPDRKHPLGPDNWGWKRIHYIKDKSLNKSEIWFRQNLRLRYNMGYAEYRKLFKAQKGRCAICKQPQTEIFGKTGEIKRLCVDHCHKTNRVRGLLCSHCNRALGKMQDSKELLQAAIDYLNKYDYTVDT